MVLIREEEEEEEGGKRGEDEEQRVCLCVCVWGGWHSVLQPSSWERLMDGGGGKGDGRVSFKSQTAAGGLSARRPASARPALW